MTFINSTKDRVDCICPLSKPKTVDGANDGATSATATKLSRVVDSGFFFLSIILADRLDTTMAAPPPQTFPYDYLFKVLIIGDASVGKVGARSVGIGVECRASWLCTGIHDLN
jgi:hypothetical protein